MGQAEARIPEMNSVFPRGWQKLQYLGCYLWPSRVHISRKLGTQEQSWNSNPGTPGIARDILSAVQQTHPPGPDLIHTVV